MREGYKETDIGVIPVEWEAIELGDIATFLKGKGISKKDISEDGVECIRYGELFTIYNEIITTIKSKTNSTTNMMYSKINDTLMPTSDVTPNGLATASALNKEGVILGGDILIIRSNDILNSYLSYFIRSHKKQIMKLVSGSTVYHIYANDMKKLKIPLPPLKEQEKIADILSTTDEKIEAIASQIQKAETLKKGLLQKLLSEGIGHSEFKESELGRIPVGWEVIPFIELADKEVSHSFTGGPFGSDLKSEHYTNTGVRVVQLQNIGDGSFLNKDFVYTSEEKAEALKNCQIFPNDIILAKMAEPVARACIMPDIETKYLMGSDGIRLHIDKKRFDNHFIFHSINYSRFRNIAIARSTGSTRLRIGLTALKKIPMAIPPLKEQKQIANILSTADEKIEVLRAKKQMYQTLKQGLMQKLLTGIVRV